MKTKKRHIALFLLLLISSYWSAFAQKDKQVLQKKYKNILSDIKGIENLINETESKKNQSINQLQSLSAKINSREILIQNINQQISVLNNNITTKNQIISSMNKEIEVLKDDYANMIYHSYKNLKSTSILGFILSSENFNQALRRINYLKSYAKYRQNQASLIKETIKGIESKIVRLEEEKKEKERLLVDEQTQKKILLTEKNEKNNLVTKLKSSSSQLKKQIKEKNKAANKLNNQIQKIIQKEILAAQAKAKEKAKKSKAAGKAYTAKEVALSKDFASNKGKLPWPVAKGHIVERFGKHPHPSLDKVTINNNGIDIRTDKNQSVLAIFGGEVVNSFYLPTTQNTLIIKHGEYFSVYSNLKSITVAVGDKVNTKQNIGIAYTNSDQHTKVHLELWKSITKLNPESWIQSL